MFSAMQILQLVKILCIRIDDREQSNISRIRKQPLVGIPTLTILRVYTAHFFLVAVCTSGIGNE